MASIADITSGPPEAVITTPNGARFGYVARALVCSEAGSLNVTRPDGSVVQNWPVLAGFNPILCSAINTPTSGTAPAVIGTIRSE